MTAYEQSMLELVKRVETLETRVQNTRDVSADVFEASKAGLESLVERLEALETEQSKAISSAAMLYAQHYHERQQAAELKRQDRWHATRDAVIVAITNGQWRPYENYKPMGLDVDAIVAHASALADRAHGPLTP